LQADRRQEFFGSRSLRLVTLAVLVRQFGYASRSKPASFGY